MDSEQVFARVQDTLIVTDAIQRRQAETLEEVSDIQRCQAAVQSGR